MPYAAAANLIARYGLPELLQCADPQQTGTPDPTIVGNALQDGADLIDGHLAARYALPLAMPYPTILIRINCSIARSFLWAEGTSPKVREDYDDAIKTLDKLGRGLIRLDVAGVEAPPAPAGDDTPVFDPGRGDRMNWRCW
jgi:phage gp36-like protein